MLFFSLESYYSEKGKIDMTEQVSTTKGKGVQLLPTLAFEIIGNSTVALFTLKGLKSFPKYYEHENMLEN